MLASFLIASVSSAAVTKTAPSGEGCLSCHSGIEKILPDTSAMMVQIKAIGSGSGDPEGCAVCHGGDPKGTSVEAAHNGAPKALIGGHQQMYEITVTNVTQGEIFTPIMVATHRSTTPVGRMAGVAGALNPADSGADGDILGGAGDW